jgi:hypothetical protein
MDHRRIREIDQGMEGIVSNGLRISANAEADVREPAHVEMQESERVPLAVNAVPAPAKGTAGIELIGAAESILFLTWSELTAIVSRFIVLIVLTPPSYDPIVLVLLPFVVIALTPVTDCPIVSCSYYCIVTSIVSRYVLPSTGLVLNVARTFLYSLSRVSCQYRNFYPYHSISGLRRAQVVFYFTHLALYCLGKAIVCYPTCTAVQYTIV